MSETEAEYIRRTRVRWGIYNLAFHLFGRTPLWPWLGTRIWG